MEFKFDINYDKDKYDSSGKLFFKINEKEYNFTLKVYTPDCDLCDSINSYYFAFEIINEFGAEHRYVEFVNCFKVLASKIGTVKFLRLFGMDVNEEFKDINKEELKQFFMEMNDYIIDKIKIHFEIDF